MINCDLTQLDDGRWWCERCDKEKERLLPVDAHRNCGDQNARGIGDTIAKLTSAVGIKPCGGCEERQKKLNELFPYKG